MERSQFKDISVKWKIITITALGLLVIAVVFGVLRVFDIRKSVVDGMVAKSRAIVLMAEAGRNEMAEKLSKGILAVTGLFIKRIESGDLTGRVTVDRGDEMGRMMHRLNGMAGHLESMMGTIGGEGTRLVDASIHL